MEYYNHIHDPVLRFKLRSEARRAEYARLHGVCIKRLPNPTKTIEKAILADLEQFKYIYVESKWNVDDTFLTKLKRKHNIPVNFKPKPVDHD